jgi:predicted KAP-like P-loop ATPase
MWPDVDTETDYLNFSEVAGLAADLICQPQMLPLSLGVFGGWGAGKSSMLRLIEKDLKSKGSNSFIIVKFDAWLFQGYDDARASLMEIISRTIWDKAKSDKTLVDQAKGLLKRVNYLRAIGTTVEIGASLALGIPPMGIMKRGIDAVGKIFSEEAEADDVETIKGEVTKLKKDAKGWLKPAETGSPPEQILTFRDEFTQVLTGLEKTLVVFIDNLDRCLPEVAIETLEAIHLFLFLPNTAFVIAADEEMIRHAVSKHYKELSGQHITDYLDKLIQIPLHVPLLGVQEVRAYMFLLFASMSGASKSEMEKARKKVCDSLQSAWKGERITPKEILEAIGIESPEIVSQLDMAERLAPILANAPNISGNPRIVKRLLNMVSMRSMLAKKHRMPVDEALLTKLGVFERCTNDESYKYLIKLINEAKEGKPTIIAELESIESTTKEFQNKCPEQLRAHIEFLAQWFALKPSLSGRDLRPAIYLCRDIVPLTHPPGELSARAIKVFQALKTVSTISSVAGKKAAESLSPTEQMNVLAGLIGELKKVTDWDSRVPGFAGAVILAETLPELGLQLAAFINQLPPRTVGRWVLPLIKNKTWAKEMLADWEKTDQSPLKKLRRIKKG